MYVKLLFYFKENGNKLLKLEFNQIRVYVWKERKKLELSGRYLRTDIFILFFKTATGNLANVFFTLVIFFFLFGIKEK